MVRQNVPCPRNEMMEIHGSWNSGHHPEKPNHATSHRLGHETDASSPHRGGATKVVPRHSNVHATRLSRQLAEAIATQTAQRVKNGKETKLGDVETCHCMEEQALHTHRCKPLGQKQVQERARGKPTGQKTPRPPRGKRKTKR